MPENVWFENHTECLTLNFRATNSQIETLNDESKRPMRQNETRCIDFQPL